LKNVLALLFISIFMFGCLALPEEQPPLANETEEEIVIPIIEEEKIIPEIRFIDYPLELNAKEGAKFVIEVKEVNNVADKLFVYVWDKSTSPSKYPVDYIYSSDSFVQSTSKNNNYESYVVIDAPGKYYARGLIVFEGEYYWSEEAVLNVLTEDGKNVRTFNVEISDTNLIPSNIDVTKGDIVVINFKAGENSHPNGVRILSPGWKDSPSLKPNQSFTVEFTATNSFTYRMFWLAGNLLKATGTVTVN